MDNENDVLETIIDYHAKLLGGNTNIHKDIEKALAQARTLNHKEAIARGLTSLAWIDYMKGNLNDAVDYYEEAISISKKEDIPKVLAACYNNQALAYSRLGDRPQAISRFFKALELFSKLGIKKQQVNVLENVGCQYTDLGELDKGEEYFLKAKEMNESLDEKGAGSLNNNMAMMYLKMEKFDEALELLKDTLQDKDATAYTLGFAYTVKAMIYYRKGDCAKSLEIVELSLKTAYENDMKGMVLRQESFRTILNAELGYYDEAKKEALSLIEKTNENANLINLYMALYKVYLHEKDFEQALNYYQLHEKCMKKVDGVKSKNHLASVEGKYQNILKEKEKEILRLQKIELEQKAMRAQLNPHFFFNALNSIHKFIMDNDQENASNFLQSFAGLMRKTLENSEESLITIEEELAFLTDYLSLEQLRFNHSFQFQFVVDEEIEEDFFKIPTMILQPYLENSIKHGLNGIDNGKIKVEFMLQDEKVLCVVEDNGRGRGFGQSAHKSMGTAILEKRLTSLNEQGNGSFSVQIIDLFDKEKKPNGTRVEIEIPELN